MRNNETGEFELVVGNRQLLSAFFIVVLLFAVAFAMGYILGQNSPRSAKVQADAAQPAAPAVASDGRPQPAPAPAAPPPQAEPQQGSVPAGSEPVDSSPQPTTQPARDVPAAPQYAAPVAAAPAPAPPPAQAATTATGPAGSFWQVIALRESEAQILVKSLRDKGYPASLTPGPNNLMRVLVGPYNDTQTMGRVKSELERLDFHPIRK
jgi:cell division septation protein DedD